MAQIAGRAVAFAIVSDGGQPVGSIELRVIDHEHAIGELGYWAAPEARGRGLTTRAVRLVSHWAIAELGAQRLQIRADVENVPSCRVAERAGFSFEGVLRSSGLNSRLGRRIDYAVYSLLPGEEA
jgi:RimJ/RimL family protein N-acetyltransferase